MKKSTKIGLIAGAVGVLLVLGVILLLIFLPSGTSNENNGKPLASKEYNSVEATIDEDTNIRTVQVPVDEKGEVKKENVSGALVDMTPAQLTAIKIENANGNYDFEVSTDSQGATTYVLKGFEEYNLNETNAALIGSAVSKITMAELVDATGENKSDYGFDNPRVTATATYSDGSNSIVYVGDDAAGNGFTYVMMEGCPSVFSVVKTDIDPLLLDLNELFDKSLRSDYTTVSDDDFTYITLGGTHFSKEVRIEHAADGSLSSFYVIASDNNMPLNTSEGSEVIGSIKSITTDGVVFANPDAGTLSSLGLDNPYATVKAEYSYASADTGAEGNLTVSMISSAPDAEGNVYLMDEGGKLVYKMSAEKLAWVTTTEKSLRSEYVLCPSYTAISSMTLTDGKETYTFDVNTDIIEVTDPETGESTTQSEVNVTFNGEKIDEAYFRTLFNDMAYITCKGDATDGEKGSEVLSVTYGYSTSRNDDTVKYFSTSSQKVIPQVNGGVADTYIYKSDIDSIMANAKALSEGKEIVSIMG